MSDSVSSKSVEYSASSIFAKSHYPSHSPATPGLADFLNFTLRIFTCGYIFVIAMKANAKTSIVQYNWGWNN